MSALAGRTECDVCGKWVLEAHTCQGLPLTRDSWCRKLDALVAQWHDSPTDDGPLRTYLGMTWDEYAAWTSNPKVLPLRWPGTHMTGLAHDIGATTYYACVECGGCPCPEHRRNHTPDCSHAVPLEWFDAACAVFGAGRFVMCSQCPQPPCLLLDER